LARAEPRPRSCAPCHHRVNSRGLTGPRKTPMTNQVQTVYIPCFCGCSSAVNFGNNTRSLSHHWSAWLKHKNKTWPLAPLHDLLFCFPLQRPCAPTCSPSKALALPRALFSPTITLSLYQPTHQIRLNHTQSQWQRQASSIMSAPSCSSYQRFYFSSPPFQHLLLVTLPS